ncbi:polysaccharide pyruvyl transferase family protein [Frigoribacterium salinisoli]
MTTEIAVHWWSPRHSPRLFLRELKDHGIAWTALRSPLSRAMTNFGDALNEVLLARVTGARVRWAPLGSEDVVAIGSVLVPYLTQGGVGLIWGSGLNREVTAQERSALDPAKVLAVRGPGTARALAVPDGTPQGDPGLLTRSFADGRRRSGAIVIPHFTVFQSAGARSRLRQLAAAGYRVVPPTTDPLDMIDAIQGAEQVLTSGMHGLILSHALRTPARLISLAETAPAAPAFKYRDYFSSVGRPAHLIPYQAFLDDDERRVQHDAAVEESEAVDASVDDLVEGLHRAVEPLR